MAKTVTGKPEPSTWLGETNRRTVYVKVVRGGPPSAPGENPSKSAKGDLLG